MVLKLVERFPIIIQAGAAVLAFTAAKMIVSEQILSGVFGTAQHPLEPIQTAARWATYVSVIVGVLAASWWQKRRAQVTP